ncbi:MAG: Sec-independent protein translocase subunit TatA/TatB [Ginsengibacter sp.]|jgi:sec-independent protein translocase protein TatA
MQLLFLKSDLLFTMPGGAEWILIFLAILLFFGGKKIPDLMRGIGRGIKEFNNAKAKVESEIQAGMNESPKTASAETSKQSA